MENTAEVTDNIVTPEYSGEIDAGYIGDNVGAGYATREVVPLAHNNIYCNYVKRVIDFVLGAMALTLAALPMLLIAIAIKLTSKGPAIFRQKRLGKNGDAFTIYKFRTMYFDAEKRLAAMMREDKKIRDEYRKNKKLRNDPRITGLGKILRETSLDELPQLINILLGTMSLVGPRPYLVSEMEDIATHKDYIFAFRPGLTGMWQINGRNKTTFLRRLELDKKYYETMSFRRDFYIIYKTAGVVLKKIGAK